MTRAKPHLLLRSVALLGSITLVLSVGCSTSSPPELQQVAVSADAPTSTLVFSSAPVRSWHAQNAAQPGVGLVEADRYEFSRNDARLAPGSRGPLLASRQWPEPPQPIERRINFRRWQQR